MATQRADAMPTVPPTDATGLPAGVDADTVIWDEVVAPGGYCAKVVARGTAIRLTDLSGEACANVLLHNAEQPTERLNVADTVKVQWQAYLGAGQLLLSDLGRAMASIVADTAAGHDTFCGATNRASNDAKYADGSVHGRSPNARDQFVVALTKHGLGRRDVGPNVSFFKPVRVGPEGELEWTAQQCPAGAVVELRAEMHLLVTVVNSPHPLDPRANWTCGPLRLTAWTAMPTSPGDTPWSATPEGERALLNTQLYYAGRPEFRP
jgi:urea carboxylase-associated protein 2